MRNSVRLLTVLAASTMLAACATRNITTPRQINPSDPAEVTLAEAAVSVSQSLKNMDEITRANTPKSKRLVKVSPYRMPGRLSIDWSGPIEKILLRIARSQDYKLRVLGIEPAIPVIVTLNDRDTAVTSILRDIDFQAGERARVRVYNNSHTIELRYTPV